VAAFKSGRNAISIEREATYIEMIKRRQAQAEASVKREGQ
jgi:DNA modification methylase